MYFGKREVDWLLREKYPRFLAESKKCLPKVRRDLERLKKGEPLAYVIGWVDFLGCKIDLSFRPLIPRPETEWWVEQFIRELGSENKKLRGKRLKILDVFAGSGCIGIAVLKHMPRAEVWFGDNNPICLKQIRKNLKLNRILPRRYRIKRSNILQNVKMSFDYLLANPPYIPSSRESRLSQSVVKHEPHSALFGGKDGLFHVRRFLKEAMSYIKPGGEIWMEFDSKQAGDIRRIAEGYGYIFDICKDQFHRLRYIRCRNSDPLIK